MEPEPLPLPLGEVTFKETTEGETSCAILFIFAPVAPISIADLPLGQLPFVDAKSALLLLSIHALTTGTLELFATAKPPTLNAPITNPTATLLNPFLIPLQKINAQTLR